MFQLVNIFTLQWSRNQLWIGGGGGQSVLGGVDQNNVNQNQQRQNTPIQATMG